MPSGGGRIRISFTRRWNVGDSIFSSAFFSGALGGWDLANDAFGQFRELAIQSFRRFQKRRVVFDHHEG